MFLIQYQILSFTTSPTHYAIQHHLNSSTRTHLNPTSTSSSSFTITLLGTYILTPRKPRHFVISTLHLRSPPRSAHHPFLLCTLPHTALESILLLRPLIDASASFIRHSLGNGLPSVISAGDSHSDLQTQPCAWPIDPGGSRCTTASNVAVHVVHYPCCRWHLDRRDHYLAHHHAVRCRRSFTREKCPVKERRRQLFRGAQARYSCRCPLTLLCTHASIRSMLPYATTDSEPFLFYCPFVFMSRTIHYFSQSRLFDLCSRRPS